MHYFLCIVVYPQLQSIMTTMHQRPLPLLLSRRRRPGALLLLYRDFCISLNKFIIIVYLLYSIIYIPHCVFMVFHYCVPFYYISLFITIIIVYVFIVNNHCLMLEYLRWFFHYCSVAILISIDLFLYFDIPRAGGGGHQLV